MKPSWPSGEIVNDVLFGKKEHLFLAQGAHRVLDFISGSMALNSDVFSRFAETMSFRREACVTRRARFLHLVFPDKHSVETEDFPFSEVVSTSKIFSERAERVSGYVVYIVDSLRGGDGCFKRTDTHLTDRGTIISVGEMLRRLGKQDADERVADFLKSNNRSLTWTGDLGVKLDPPISAVETFFHSEPLDLWFHNNLGGGNNGIVDLHFSFKPVYPERVLFFGDSFGREVCRFLGALFTDVVFLRTPHLHPELVDAIKPDIVISENVERYLHNFKGDDDRGSFFMYPHLKGEPYQPTVEFAEAFSAVMSYPREPYWQLREKISPTMGERLWSRGLGARA